MVLKGISFLLLALSLTGCHSQAAQQTQGRSAPVAEGDWSLPYGKWEFAFFTPEGLPATVTHVRIVDTAGYLNTFNTLDGTQSNPYSVGKWSEKVRRSSIHFNKASHPPQYMVFCWDSIIDMKTYETSLFFPQEVWEKMRTPASHKARSGNTVWYKTMLFGLAPEGKVRVWLQDVGDYPNYPVPVIKLQTLSGDKLDVCKRITKHSKGYSYTQKTQDFIKGKTYPYGAW
ncbi:DUF2931 family protein [Rahnella sikkimica]|uniref:DUF2931 domain-containing protein n=1 Tax=Rahnella sikkimica TaxID=1805933 RepID=A0A2L1UPV0_9GAMM|nr:DUF2931 family protein [Rahnella sikkimica]AVF34969.1 hypothetical protein BV494_08480 [Rahnella sikkimica]